MPHPETFTPESLDEVAALLLAADDDVCPVPCGTRLLARVNGVTTDTMIVELARVPELNRLDYEERNGLLIGAAVPLAESLRFPPLEGAYAILADGIACGDCSDRWTCGTLGECLGVAAPVAALAVPLICLGASVAIFGPHGWSEMSVEALCAPRRGWALQPGEFLVDVRLPAVPGPSGGAFARAPSDGIAEHPFGAGAFLVLRDDRETCCGARLSVSIASGPPFRALDAERFLQGRRLDDAAVERAGDLAQDGTASNAARSTGLPLEALRDVTRAAVGRAWERARARPVPSSGARRA
jgi:carbon-monoxide dehydrogenase medium subunit